MLAWAAAEGTTLGFEPELSFLLRLPRLWLLDGWAVRLGFAVDPPGKLVVGLAFLVLFSLAFSERGGAFTFGDNRAPNLGA